MKILFTYIIKKNWYIIKNNKNFYFINFNFLSKIRIWNNLFEFVLFYLYYFKLICFWKLFKVI